MNLDLFTKLLPSYLARDLSERERESIERFAKGNREAKTLLVEGQRIVATAVDMGNYEPSAAVIARLLETARKEIESNSQANAGGRLLILKFGIGFSAAAAAVVVLVSLAFSAIPESQRIGEILWNGPHGQSLNAELSAGDVIATGSNGSYVLRLNSGVNLQLGQYTELAVDGGTVNLVRGNMVVDGAKYAPELDIVTGEQRSTVEFKQPALVAFEYSTHVKRIGKTSATTYDVDYERVPLRDVIELGQRFGVTVEADAPVAAQADRVFIDLKSDSLDRDGYIQALEKKIPSIGLALRNTTAGVYRLIDHSTGHRDDLAWEPHRLNVVVRSGSARVGTTRLAQRASSGVQQVIVGRSEQAPRNPTPSEAKVILSNVVLNADVRFDVPLSDGSAGMTAALSRDIGALQIIRHVFPVDSAIADINGKDVWIKANNGMKLYEVGKSATFGKTSGKLLSANDRGALIETDGGQTVHVSFQ